MARTLGRTCATFCLAIMIKASLGLIVLARPQNSTTGSSAPAELARQSQHSMSLNVNLVLVPVSVTDMKDRPVLDLGPDDFALFQDEEQQKIEYFSSEEIPISIGLLLDVSNSMTSKFEMERAAVTAFFRNANSQDDYFAITFADRPEIAASSTQSIDEIQSGLTGRLPKGNTALFDAISAGMDQMQGASQRRKALLIISDGADNYSRHHLKQIKRLVRDSDVEVYAIAITDAGPLSKLEGSHGKRWLTEITDASGGQTIAVDKQETIPDAAGTISREMRSRYILGYRPGTVRTTARSKIKVEISPIHKAKHTFHIHYKDGYQAVDHPIPSTRHY